MNINKLKGKIVESGRTVGNVATEIGINPATLYRKLAHNGDSITIREARELVRVLNISTEEANEIFFTHKVA